MRKYTKHTKENLEPIVRSSKSYAECLRKLGLKDVGGNYSNLQKNIDKYQLDTSHFLHQASNKGREFKKFEDLIKPESIKKRLINYRGHSCECCDLSLWLGKLISLELHHIDGNRRNNSGVNLQLLCPNCHSFTSNWRNRK